jgi:recombination protein RecR
MNIPSKLIEDAVEQMGSLPGIGKKTALRLVLNLLQREPHEVEVFAEAFTSMRGNILFCKSCHNVSDREVCDICENPKRSHALVCVVEDIRDVMAIENTQQFGGIYHVLGGIISPMDGIGPQDLTIDSLVEKAEKGEVTEVLLALSTTMEGDTTNFYIYKKLKDYPVAVTTIARGISIGDEIEYADEVTLGRSIINRTPYANSLVK